MQCLRFPAPTTFDGKVEHWDLFQYKFRAYLCLSDTRFKDLFKVVEASADEIDLDLQTDQTVIALATQLQNALIALTEGPAANIVQRQSKSELSRELETFFFSVMRRQGDRRPQVE